MSVPTYKKPPTPIGVQELREFIAPHGPDVAVLVTWTHERGYQFLTAGIDAPYADSAVKLRDVLADALHIALGRTTEDLRSEHPKPEPWTEEQKQILAGLCHGLDDVRPKISTERLLQALYDRTLTR